jgi:putative multiple sugar transport system permease protein
MSENANPSGNATTDVFASPPVDPNVGESLGSRFVGNLRQSGIVLAFVAIVGLFTILTHGDLLLPNNITNMVLQYSYILVLAIGMVIVIIGGHIDLSVGAVVALAGAVSAILVIKDGLPWWVGVLAAIGVGLLVGVWQGFWVAFVGIPAFITTLAGMLLFRGMAWGVLNNVSLSGFPKQYQNIANGFINGWLGGNGYDLFTIVIFAVALVAYAWSSYRARRARIAYNQPVLSLPLFILQIVAVSAVVMWFAYQLASARGLPYVLIILGSFVMIYTVVTTRTVFGRHVYAIGGNLAAATLSGVKVKWVNFGIMLNMGFLSGVAGVLFSARLNGAQPNAGTGFELDAIAACFIGGAAVTGGVGRVTGAIVGGLVMAVLSNGMLLLGWPLGPQQIVKGLVLVAAVAFDVLNKRRAGTR